MHARRAGMMLAIGAMAAIAACSSFDASEDPAGATQDGSADGAVAEGAVGEGGGDLDGGGGDGGGQGDGGGDAGPVNLLTNGGFETACGSGIWGNNEAILTVDTTAARTGTKSCRVCGKNDAGSWAITQEVSLGLAVGQTYVAEAWVRAPLTGVSANPLSMPLEARKDFTKVQEILSSQDTATDTWKLFTATITLNDAGATGTKLHMGILANKAEGCFLIDDAKLYRAP